MLIKLNIPVLFARIFHLKHNTAMSNYCCCRLTTLTIICINAPSTRSIRKISIGQQILSGFLRLDLRCLYLFQHNVIYTDSVLLCDLFSTDCTHGNIKDRFRICILFHLKLFRDRLIFVGQIYGFLAVWSPVLISICILMGASISLQRIRHFTVDRRFHFQGESIPLSPFEFYPCLL